MEQVSLYEQMTVYQQIRQGLLEAIAHARGEPTLKSATLAAPTVETSRDDGPISAEPEHD
jgi:hypothetical protein